MATRKRRSSRTKTRTVYRTAPRRSVRRRSNGLNRSVKKKIATCGAAIGAGQYLVPLAVNCIQTKSVAPVAAAFTNKNTLMAMAKDTALGYAIGYGVGMACDITGLKKPINKIAKKVKF